ncbi:MAG: YciI family protein [Pseudomonadota bacterium]
MRYTLLLYREESVVDTASAEDDREYLAAFGAYIGALKEAGVFIETDWLQPAPTATVITLKDGERRVQDGPYADTREQLGGYFAIDVPDLDAALAWAEKCPAARYGLIEVRPSAMPPDRNGA